MNAQLNSVLEKIRGSLAESMEIKRPTPVDQPAGHPSQLRSIRDMFFDVVDEISDRLQVVYGMPVKKAFTLISDVGDMLCEKGQMPPFPTDSMNDAEIARWVNAASYSSFNARVMEAALIKSMV